MPVIAVDAMGGDHAPTEVVKGVAQVSLATDIDCLLVGDSLGMVVQGQTSTLPVTLEEMAYHVRCTARGNRRAWLIGDLPFGSYQQSPAQALASATVLMQAGAQMVKLEGGGWTTETVRAPQFSISWMTSSTGR